MQYQISKSGLKRAKKINFFIDRRLLSNCVRPRRHALQRMQRSSKRWQEFEYFRKPPHSVYPRDCDRIYQSGCVLVNNKNKFIAPRIMYSSGCTAQTYVDQPWPVEPDRLRDRWTVVRFDGTIRNFPAHARRCRHASRISTSSAACLTNRRAIRPDSRSIDRDVT